MHNMHCGGRGRDGPQEPRAPLPPAMASRDHTLFSEKCIAAPLSVFVQLDIKG